MRLTLTGVLVRESGSFSALCPELDIATAGASVTDAKAMLLEAASLHVEGAIEDGLPYLRPVPPTEDPRSLCPNEVAEEFRFHLDVAVRASA